MKKLLVLILFGTAVLFGFTGCGNSSAGEGAGTGTGNESGADTGDNTGTGDETGSGDNTGSSTGQETSAPEVDAPVEVGDLVLSNGKYITSFYANQFKMSKEQKESVVAVIFDVENKKGIGLKEAKGLAWAIEESLCGNVDSSQRPSVSYLEVAKNESDGKVNMQEIKALPDYDQEHYPAFWWADNYGVKVKDSAKGWYIPAKNELDTIINSISLNSRLEYFGGDVLNQKYYWTSTHCAGGGEAYAYEKGNRYFKALDYTEENKIQAAYVRVVRVFD